MFQTAIGEGTWQTVTTTVTSGSGEPITTSVRGKISLF